MYLANPFPDSKEKRELRRRDRHLLREFMSATGKSGLRYCGLPSVEFLDVREWASLLSTVTAVEIVPKVADAMRLQIELQDFGMPVNIVQQDLYRYVKGPEIFDLYNLDFFKGMTYARESNISDCIEALKGVFASQGHAKTSFVLIATFQIRDSGKHDYLNLLEHVKKDLASHQNAYENLEQHKTSNSRRLKFCFPYSCGVQAQANGFQMLCQRPTMYHSSVSMMHFHLWFLYDDKMLPRSSSASSIEIANQTLYKMEGQVPVPEFVPLQIDVQLRPSD